MNEGGQSRLGITTLVSGRAGSAPFARTDHDQPSVFLPENLLREARRQRRLANAPVPAICLLDPDGDVVRHLQRTGRGRPSPSWACYHTELWESAVDELPIGIVGRAVGAPFAVLVAEQLFVSGCELLISITSAGKVAPDLLQPSIILIDQALRGEGTSFAYLPPSPTVAADATLVAAIADSVTAAGIDAIRGLTWTTDAPFRETAAALDAAAAAGALAVEMEAAALYAFAAARRRPVVCFAHVTNALAIESGDFEKGPAAGAAQALAITAATARGWSTWKRGAST